MLIFNGEKRFDGKIHEFEKILGAEKNISFSFKSPQVECDFLKDYDPKWNENNTNLSLRVPIESVNEVGKYVLDKMSPIEFNTDKMPIERVMKTLMERPELLEQPK
ncbi:MAG: hypothetical protein CME61_01365 [Halobacteriovoraceae bacterium]|nr:hypothetical protein [Halobacteriovoraceae bacterium]